jgi:hypothetical protein
MVVVGRRASRRVRTARDTGWFGQDHRRAGIGAITAGCGQPSGPGRQSGPEILRIGKMSPARERQAGYPAVNYGEGVNDGV